MNPWLVYPTWQHFSSLFREVTTAHEQQHEWLRYHHLTSALYYAISFVEALLNEKYRERLEAVGMSEEEILMILRRGSSTDKPKAGRSFDEKFAEWPSIISGKTVTVSEDLRKMLSEFNDVRGNLTHSKSRGYDVYEDLEKVSGRKLLGAVAGYAITTFAALNERYPYWLFGWNYLNPNKSGLDPCLINDQQFLHSLNYLGLNVPSFDANAAEAWKDVHLKSYDSYKRLSQFLENCPPCEPFDSQFPFRPRLVRTWWDPDVFEKNKHLVKRRGAPIIYGTAVISPAIIAPIRIRAQPVDESESQTPT